MARFITVGESVIDTGDKAWATDYHKRTDGLYDVRMVVDGFIQSMLSFGVGSIEEARVEVVRQLSIPGVVIDIRDRGTGEQDAPNIIRPQGSDAASLLKM